MTSNIRDTMGEQRRGKAKEILYSFLSRRKKPIYWSPVGSPI